MKLARTKVFSDVLVVVGRGNDFAKAGCTMSVVVEPSFEGEILKL
jgi:hypothetical protein